MKKNLFILSLSLLACFSASAQKAMNRPYIDDKLFHFGFSLGVNFMDYSLTTTEEPQTGNLWGSDNKEIPVANAFIDARCSYMYPGFSVGFIGDLRLCKYLNLRFIPQLQFADRDIKYRAITGSDTIDCKTSILAIPVAIPLELKWSAERCGNYRPYVTVGGGVSYNCFVDEKKPISPARLDYFMEIGAGCDFYFSWFKLCPQIKYTLGFKDVSPAHDAANEYLNSSIVNRMRNHMISLVFNFE